MRIEHVPVESQHPSELSRMEAHPGSNEEARGAHEVGENSVIDFAHTSPLSRILSQEMAHMRKEQPAVSLSTGKSASFTPETSLPDAVVDTIYQRMRGE